MLAADITTGVAGNDGGARKNHDALTGLSDHAVMRERIVSALRRSRRHGASAGTVCLLLIDVDGFKRINDEHGYAVGDLPLANVASRLRQAIDKDAAGKTRRLFNLDRKVTQLKT